MPIFQNIGNETVEIQLTSAESNSKAYFLVYHANHLLKRIVKFMRAHYYIILVLIP